MLHDVLGNRKHIRMKSEIDIIFDTDPSFKGRVLNINIEGCKVAVLNELLINSEHKTILKLPERDVRVNCACVRSEHQHKLFECVLLYDDPSPSIINCIEEYMSSILGNLEDAIRLKAI